MLMGLDQNFVEQYYQLPLRPNAHHHPPKATITEARHFETGRVNDVVGLQYFVSKGTK